MSKTEFGQKSKKKIFSESDQLRNIVTATIATLGLESFNADTNSNYELVTMVPVDCATSDLDEPNCIGTRSFVIFKGVPKGLKQVIEH